MNMSWTRKQIVQLIEEYQKYPCLYVFQDRNYHNKRKRMSCLSKIAKELSDEIRPFTSKAEVQKKLNGILKLYTLEREKLSASMSNGQPEDVYTPSLWYYENLSFLLQDQNNVPNAKSNFVDTETAYVAECEIHGGDLIVEQEEPQPSISSRGTSREPATPESRDGRIPRQGKKRKKSETTDEPNAITFVDVSECLRSSSNVFKSHMKVRPAVKLRTEEDVYSEYVAIRFKALKSSRKKLQIRYQIDNLLYEAAINDK